MIRLSALADRVRALRGRNRAFLALLSGALAALSMPPFDLWPALFIALPMLVWLSQADAGWRSSFLAGWLFGLGYFGVSFYWVGIAFLVDAATYLWMMPFMVGGLAGGMAVYWGLAVMLASRWCASATATIGTGDGVSAARSARVITSATPPSLSWQQS